MRNFAVKKITTAVEIGYYKNFEEHVFSVKQRDKWLCI